MVSSLTARAPQFFGIFQVFEHGDDLFPDFHIHYDGGFFAFFVGDVFYRFKEFCYCHTAPRKVIIQRFGLHHSIHRRAQPLHNLIHFFLADDQRRGEGQGGAEGTGAQAARLGGFENAHCQGRVGGFGGFV